jgi:hypothetical protein
VQVAPAQDVHEQVFEVVVLCDMTSSFDGVVNEEQCRTALRRGIE